MLAHLPATLVMEKTIFPGDLVFASQLFQQLCYFLRKLCLSLNEILKCFISKPHTKCLKGPDLGILEDRGALKGDLREGLQSKEQIKGLQPQQREEDGDLEGLTQS